MKKDNYFIGIDEVGRGSLAGPVTVAALAAPPRLKFQIPGLVLKDSKRLSVGERLRWFEYLKNHQLIFFAVASVSPKVIDRINISRAANLAATRALKRLLVQLEQSPVPSGRLQIANQHRLAAKCKVFLDGGLYVDKKLLTACHWSPKNVRTVVRGDERYACVKLASVAAKVIRDRHMANPKLDGRGRYQLARHKGYGTAAHLAAIKKYGPTAMHRLTFLGRFRNIPS